MMQSESRSWSHPQEPTTEDWWADVLADPRARTPRRRGSAVAVERTFYRLADKPREVILVACSKCEWKAAFRRDDLGRVLINSDCSASPPKRRNMLSLSEAQAIFFLRRHQPRRPPLAKIRPGRPAPTMGPGTWAKKPRISPLPKVEL